VYACVAALGGVNDIAAFRKTSLSQTIRNFPAGKFIIGDNSYVCLEHLLTPFSGDKKRDPCKDAYNFYLSQLRIRVEQTFGFMTTKWQILRKPLQIWLKHVGRIFLRITRLHNFCTNEGYDVENIEEGDGDLTTFIPSDTSVTEVEGNSLLQDIIVQELAQQSLGRPQHNLERN